MNERERILALEARVKALEERLAILEARPLMPYPQPHYIGTATPPVLPYEVTCLRRT